MDFKILLGFINHHQFLCIDQIINSALKGYPSLYAGQQELTTGFYRIKKLFLTKVLACQSWARACKYSAYVIFN